MCRETKGRFVNEAVRYWHERYPWESPGIDEVAREILDAVAKLVETSLELKPGAHHAIGECRARGLKLAIASSAPLGIIESAVRRFDLEEAFKVSCSAEHEHAGKPDPAVFLTAARLLGTEPERCLVFEDSLAGVRAAKSGGMLCVAVPERLVGPDGEHSKFVAADVILDSLEDLDEAVWKRLELHRGSKVRAVKAHVPPGRAPIVVVPGEELTVGERDDEWPAFVLVTTSSGAQGWVPERRLELFGDGRGTPVRRYDTTEMAIVPGTELTVVEADLGSGWLWCKGAEGAQGWVPVGCVDPSDGFPS
jgi:mannitol-1-/sugar-/sorbitol-6-/2-deoxyglucose-6-phosphatase